VVSLCGSGFLARGAGSSWMRPDFRAAQPAFTGQAAQLGVRVQTIAPRSISAWV
jgi:hypothetical protein